MPYSLAGFAAMLIEATVLLPAAEERAMEKAAVLLETAAKDSIGVPNGMWPPLSELTIERKGTNTPLLDTGEMKDSIAHNADAHEAYIGSNNKKLLYHEFGSVNVPFNTTNPPRPVLGLAVIRKGEEAAHIIGREVLTAIKIL